MKNQNELYPVYNHFKFWFGALTLLRLSLRSCCWLCKGMIAVAVITCFLGVLSPVNGSGAWVRILGVNVQTGELFKIFVVLFAAYAFPYLKEDKGLNTLFYVTCGVLCGALLVENDSGNMMIFALLVVMVAFLDDYLVGSLLALSTLVGIPTLVRVAAAWGSVEALPGSGSFARISSRFSGMLTALDNDSVHFSLRFKNEQVKRCLTKAGTILELKTYLIATSLTEQDGSARYNDVMTGVFIDWDGVVHEQTESAVDTENEIDLVLMRGLVPVFVSCKNGAVGEAELYKLNTVANRFGGAYARKLLIGTTLGKSGRGKQYFLQRAKDMKIQVLDEVHTLSDEQFRKKLKAFA